VTVVIMGPPGAGKGTQAAAVKSRFGIPHISTGGMLREAIAVGTPVGLKAKAIVEAGNLVSDEIMAEMMRERLSASDAQEGFLLDGYPRNVDQGATLEGILETLGRSLAHVVSLALSDEEIIRRLSGRRVCRSCGTPFHVDAAPPKTPEKCDACGGTLEQRPDDQPEVVERRLQVYREMTEPLIQYYRERDLLRDVDGMGTVEQVGRRILDVLS
jgi:adenylate kinase